MGRILAWGLQSTPAEFEDVDFARIKFNFGAVESQEHSAMTQLIDPRE
jgi:hypothetical protein